MRQVAETASTKYEHRIFITDDAVTIHGPGVLAIIYNKRFSPRVISDVKLEKITVYFFPLFTPKHIHVWLWSMNFVNFIIVVYEKRMRVAWGRGLSAGAAWSEKKNLHINGQAEISTGVILNTL